MIVVRKPLDFYKKASQCARYYGFFSDAELIELIKTGSVVTRPLKEKRLPMPERKGTLQDSAVREFEGALRLIANQGALPSGQPLLFFTTSASSGVATFSLHIFGMRQSIAEALLIKTTLAILNDMGVPQPFTFVNSIGCNDSSAKFIREITNTLKRQMDSLPPQVRELFKVDTFLAYHHVVQKELLAQGELPRSMEYLSSVSRKHLRELLEFLEAADIPYSFDDHLLGHRECYHHTMFEVRSNDEFSPDDRKDSVVLARGGRYDELAKRFFKSPVSAVGATIRIKTERVGIAKNERDVSAVKKKPRAYFISLGYAAELKTLTVLEALRRARIPLVPLTRTFTGVRLSDHLAYAEEYRIPYTLIFGQKEALENSIIVRDTETRAQQTVSLDALPIFFKADR